MVISEIESDGSGEGDLICGSLYLFGVWNKEDLKGKSNLVEWEPFLKLLVKRLRLIRYRTTFHCNLWQEEEN